MSLASSVAVWLAALVSVAAARPAPPLRVCADPNNMPFSDVHRDGFENRIAALVARDLGRPLAYVWAPQRRGFVRNTLDAGRCDLIVGVPAGFGRLRTTQAYYRSSYVFVSRHDRHLRLASFDDPRLVVHRSDERQGLAASLNRALDVAQGEWIARLDADDVALPRRLELQLARIRRAPPVAIVGSGALEMDVGVVAGDDARVHRRSRQRGEHSRRGWRRVDPPEEGRVTVPHRVWEHVGQRGGDQRVQALAALG